MVHSPAPRSHTPSMLDKYVSAFELAPSGMFILDIDGRFLAVNDKMANIFGYSREEMIGHSIDRVLPERYRKKYLRQRNFLEHLQRHQLSGVKRVFYGVRQDGSEFPIGVSLSAYQVQNRTFVIGVIADITQNRRFLNQHRGLSQHFKQLLDSSATIIYIVDLSVYQETYISGNVSRLLGYSSQEVLGEKNFWYRHLHPEDRSKVVKSFHKQLESGEGVLEYRFRQVNGDYVWIYDNFRVIRYSDGKPTEMQGSWTDISIRKTIEQQRDRIESELRLAQKLETIGQLASGIAHEINTPIQFVGDSLYFLQTAFEDYQNLLGQYRTALTRFSASPLHDQVLAELRTAEEESDLAYLEEEAPQAFTRVFEGIERVTNIVRAMKEFGHNDQREKSPVDLNKALQNTLTVARNEYKYVAEVKAEFGEIPTVECLAGDINQVFLNLIVNAAHAIEEVVETQGGKGEISIRTFQQGEDVIIEIQDTGTGIPAEIAQRVFDPFFTTKEIGKGTGQGLAIARHIVIDKHGGSLTFDSQPGIGTTFSIRLPICASQQTEEIQREEDSVCG